MEKHISREHLRDELRRDMPLVAVFIDEMRNTFPDARVTYAEEKGRSIGRKRRVRKVGKAHDGAIIVVQIRDTDRAPEKETGA